MHTCGLPVQDNQNHNSWPVMWQLCDIKYALSLLRERERERDERDVTLKYLYRVNQLNYTEYRLLDLPGPQGNVITRRQTTQL